MTRDDIIRMAKNEFGIYAFTADDLARFVAIISAAECEACCSIVYGQCGSDNVAQRTVDAIRARKNELYQMQRQHEGS